MGGNHTRQALHEILTDLEVLQSKEVHMNVYCSLTEDLAKRIGIDHNKVPNNMNLSMEETYKDSQKRVIGTLSPPHLRKWTQLQTLKQATITIKTLQKRLISRNENRSGISVPTNLTGLVNGSKPRLPPIRKTDDIVTATSLHIVSSPVILNNEPTNIEDPNPFMVTAAASRQQVVPKPPVPTYNQPPCMCMRKAGGSGTLVSLEEHEVGREQSSVSHDTTDHEDEIPRKNTTPEDEKTENMQQRGDLADYWSTDEVLETPFFPSIKRYVSPDISGFLVEQILGFVIPEPRYMPPKARKRKATPSRSATPKTAKQPNVPKRDLRTRKPKQTTRSPEVVIATSTPTSHVQTSPAVVTSHVQTLPTVVASQEGEVAYHLRRLKRICRDPTIHLYPSKMQTALHRVVKAAKDAGHKRLRRFREVKAFFLANASREGIGKVIEKMVMTPEERKFAEEAEKAQAAFRNGARATPNSIPPLLGASPMYHPWGQAQPRPTPPAHTTTGRRQPRGPPPQPSGRTPGPRHHYISSPHMSPPRYLLTPIPIALNVIPPQTIHYTFSLHSFHYPTPIHPHNPYPTHSIPSDPFHTPNSPPLFIPPPSIPPYTWH
ncbi:hypothetical protein Bbelb_187420 [Branchiostoma belcheri]|nr:hypothetical protein Bbelb_187420 [Branchiostoma belcheri]